MRGEYFIVLKKEMLEILRDRRSMITLLMPIIMFPLLFSIINFQLKAAKKDDNEKTVLSITDENIKLLFPENKFDFCLTDTPENAVAEGKADCAVLNGENGLCVAYDASSVKSTTALNSVVTYLNMMRESAVYNEIVNCGGNADILNETLFEMRVISPESGNGSSSVLASLAPSLLIMLIFGGGMSVAVDAFAGEKDRKTLENLLLTKVRRGSLYGAKLTNVVIVSLVSMITSLSGYLIAISLNKDILLIFGESELILPPITVIMLILLVVTTTAIFASALMCFMSVASRGAKEAQLKLGIISAIPSILSLIVMYTENAKVSIGMMFVPILNSIAFIKLAFSGVMNNSYMITATISNLAYALALSLIALRLFKREQVLR